MILLLKINHLELLHQLFGEIQIPDAVYKELTLNDKFKQQTELIFQTKLIKKTNRKDIASVTLLKQSIGLKILQNNERYISSQLYHQEMNKINRK